MEATSPRLPKLQPWYWAAPRIAIGLFVLAVIALLWLLHRQELEEHRAGLIGDALWVEQNLQFNLTRSQEHLQQLGQDYFAGNRPVAGFAPRIRSFLLNNPGVAHVQILDGDGLALRKEMIERSHHFRSPMKQAAPQRRLPGQLTAWKDRSRFLCTPPRWSPCRCATPFPCASSSSPS
jgi:hypothetical protein